MIVFAKSLKRAGELVSISFVEMEASGLDAKMNLVSKKQPIPIAVVAFEDQFAYGPLGDFIPIWNEKQLEVLTESGTFEGELVNKEPVEEEVIIEDVTSEVIIE
jgi:hypothetical protein